MAHRLDGKRRDMHSGSDFVLVLLWALGLIVFVGIVVFLASLVLS